MKSYQYSAIMFYNGLNRYFVGKHTYLARRSTMITKVVPLGWGPSIAQRLGWPLRLPPNVGNSRASFLLVGDCVRAIPLFLKIFISDTTRADHVYSLWKIHQNCHKVCINTWQRNIQRNNMRSWTWTEVWSLWQLWKISHRLENDMAEEQIRASCHNQLAKTHVEHLWKTGQDERWPM